MKAEWREKLKTHHPDKYKKLLANEAKRKRDAKADNKPKGLSNPERVEMGKLKKQNKALETEKGKLEAEVTELKAANAALKKARDDWKEEAENTKPPLPNFRVHKKKNGRKTSVTKRQPSAPDPTAKV